LDCDVAVNTAGTNVPAVIFDGYFVQRAAAPGVYFQMLCILIYIPPEITLKPLTVAVLCSGNDVVRNRRRYDTSIPLITGVVITYGGSVLPLLQTTNVHSACLSLPGSVLCLLANFRPPLWKKLQILLRKGATLLGVLAWWPVICRLNRNLSSLAANQ